MITGRNIRPWKLEIRNNYHSMHPAYEKEAILFLPSARKFTQHFAEAIGKVLCDHRSRLRDVQMTIEETYPETLWKPQDLANIRWRCNHELQKGIYYMEMLMVELNEASEKGELFFRARVDKIMF